MITKPPIKQLKKIIEESMKRTHLSRMAQNAIIDRYPNNLIEFNNRKLFSDSAEPQIKKLENDKKLNAFMNDLNISSNSKKKEVMNKAVELDKFAFYARTSGLPSKSLFTTILKSSKLYNPNIEIKFGIVNDPEKKETMEEIKGDLKFKKLYKIFRKNLTYAQVTEQRLIKEGFSLNHNVLLVCLTNMSTLNFTEEEIKKLLLRKLGDKFGFQKVNLKILEAVPNAFFVNFFKDKKSATFLANIKSIPYNRIDEEKNWICPTEIKDTNLIQKFDKEFKDYLPKEYKTELDTLRERKRMEIGDWKYKEKYTFDLNHFHGRKGIRVIQEIGQFIGGKKFNPMEETDQFLIFGVANVVEKELYIHPEYIQELSSHNMGAVILRTKLEKDKVTYIAATQNYLSLKDGDCLSYRLKKLKNGYFKPMEMRKYAVKSYNMEAKKNNAVKIGTQLSNGK